MNVIKGRGGVGRGCRCVLCMNRHRGGRRKEGM